MGPQSISIALSSSGKVNKAIYFNNPAEDAQAYFSLGNYPSTSYCFPDPERCPEGITVAFWLKIVGGAGPSQGIITTQPGGGPGFQVYFNNVNLIFGVRRDSDTIVEVVTDYVNDFVSTYGFGTWVHCIMVICSHCEKIC